MHFLNRDIWFTELEKCIYNNILLEISKYTTNNKCTNRKTEIHRYTTNTDAQNTKPHKTKMHKCRVGVSSHDGDACVASECTRARHDR